MRNAERGQRLQSQKSRHGGQDGRKETDKMKRMFNIKIKIGEVLGLDIKDFELIKSGKKGGRPNLEVEHHDAPHKRYAFTCFDETDIYDLHEVIA